jgi:hypothetical protein
LVKLHQNDYLKAKKRDKPQVAAVVVEKIRQKGGRFLRRYTSKSEGVFWVDIGDMRAREKTCQALREGAPEIRRKKTESNTDASNKHKDGDVSLSAASTFDRIESSEGFKVLNGGRTQIVRTTFETEKKEAVSIAAASMVIRPSMSLLCRASSDKPLAIPIDHLDQQQREIYLRDFLPPNPSIQKTKLNLTPIDTSVAEKENMRDESVTDMVDV